MKIRETINSNAEEYICTVYENAGKIIARKHETSNYYDTSTDEVFEFGSIAEYEKWKASQEWIKKVEKVSSFSAQRNVAAVARYDAEYAQRVYIKLNKKTDADILEALAKVDNKQGFIKELIRKAIK